MALLTCPECGNAVSDQSQVCPICGYPVADIVEKSKQQKHTSLKKKLVTVISIVVLVAVCGVIVYFVGSLKSGLDPNGYYKGLEWGTTYEDVKATIGDDSVSGDEKGFFVLEDNYLGLDVDAGVMYNFENGGLDSVSLFITPQDDSDVYMDEILEKIRNKLNKAYGESNKIEMEGIANETWSVSGVGKISILYETSASVDSCMVTYKAE